MKKYVFLFLMMSFMISCSEAVIEDLPTDPITNQVNYVTDVKIIIDNNCVGCHGAVSPSAGLSLTNYTQVRNAAENGNLINRINNVSNPMPQSGLMSSSNRAIIDKWVIDGYLEN
ncbi:MAG: hypothetical protein JXQ93_01825 [Flavobacteriaceae bacterium]